MAGNALRALSAAYEVTRDRDRSIFWYRNTPIPEFGRRTAEQIVAGAKSDAIIRLFCPEKRVTSRVLPQ
jgi:hypothetical protein